MASRSIPQQRSVRLPPSHEATTDHGSLGGGGEPDQRLAAIHQSIIECERCPRLRSYCLEIARDKRRAFRDETYWGRPVPGFGDPSARLLLLGLAPAAHGANRTGRVFTGDGVGGSGDFLMTSLYRTGFANIPTSQRIDDGLVLNDAYISAAVRCAPPGNAPAPDEITHCLDHLEAEIDQLKRIQVVVALGKIAFDVWLRVLKRRGTDLPTPRPQFAHGSMLWISAPDGAPGIVLGCYHPSRQNTNTGKLTPAMMTAVFRKAKGLLR